MAKKRLQRLVHARNVKKVNTTRLKDLADSLIREAKHITNDTKKKQFYGTATDLSKCVKLYQQGKVTVAQVGRVIKDAEAKLGHRRKADRLRQKRHRAGKSKTNLFGYENCDSVLEKSVRGALPDFEQAKDFITDISEENCGVDVECQARALLAIGSIVDGLDKFAKHEAKREAKRSVARAVQRPASSEAYRKRIDADERAHRRIQQFFNTLKK